MGEFLTKFFVKLCICCIITIQCANATIKKTSDSVQKQNEKTKQKQSITKKQVNKKNSDKKKPNNKATKAKIIKKTKVKKSPPKEVILTNKIPSYTEETPEDLKEKPSTLEIHNQKVRLELEMQQKCLEEELQSENAINIIERVKDDILKKNPEMELKQDPMPKQEPNSDASSLVKKKVDFTTSLGFDLVAVNNINTKAFVSKINIKSQPFTLDSRFDYSSTIVNNTDSLATTSNVTNTIADAKVMPFVNGLKKNLFISIYNRSILTQTKNSSTADSKDIISSIGPGIKHGPFSGSISYGMDVKTMLNASKQSIGKNSSDFIRFSTSFEKEVPQMFLIKKSFKIKADISYYDAFAAYNLKQISLSVSKKIDDFVDFNIFYNMEQLKSSRNPVENTSRRRLSFSVLFNIL